MNPETLAAAARGLPQAPVFVAQTSSTMADARRLAVAGATHGSWVVAGEQSEGRGRLARVWTTTDVALTAVLRPALPTRRLGLLAIAAAVAVQEACGAPFAIKWPNDVLAPDGRKVAGVLCEVESQGAAVGFALVGVGVNVRRAPDAVPTATCLNAFAAAPHAPEAVAAAVMAALLDAVSLTERDPAALLARWRDRAATVGRRVRVGDVVGVVTGVDVDGALIVQPDVGPAVVVHSGDVVHVA